MSAADTLGHPEDARPEREAASALEADARMFDELRRAFLAKGNGANGHAAKPKHPRGKDGRMTAPLDAIPARLSGEIAATVELSEDAVAVVFASAYQGRLLFETLRGEVVPVGRHALETGRRRARDARNDSPHGAQDVPG